MTTDQELPEQYITVCAPCGEYIQFASDAGFLEDDHYHDAKDALDKLQEYAYVRHYNQVVSEHPSKCELCDHRIARMEWAHIIEVKSLGDLEES